MAEPTNSERILALEKIAQTISVRLDHLDRQLIDFSAAQKDTIQKLATLCHKYELEASHQVRDINDLKTWKAEQKTEQDDRKKWRRSFGPNIIAAILTIILTPLSVIAWTAITVWLKKK